MTPSKASNEAILLTYRARFNALSHPFVRSAEKLTKWLADERAYDHHTIPLVMECIAIATTTLEEGAENDKAGNRLWEQACTELKKTVSQVLRHSSILSPPTICQMKNCKQRIRACIRWNQQHQAQIVIDLEDDNGNGEMPKLEELNIAVSSPSPARLELERQAYIRRLKQVDDLVEETVWDNSASGPPSVVADQPEVNEPTEIEVVNVDDKGDPKEASVDDCNMEEIPGDDGHREPDSSFQNLVEETVWDNSATGPPSDISALSAIEPPSVPKVSKPAEIGIVNVDDTEDPKTREASADDCAMEEAPGDDGQARLPDSPLQKLVEETVWDNSAFGPLSFVSAQPAVESPSVPEVNEEDTVTDVVNVNDAVNPKESSADDCTMEETPIDGEHHHQPNSPLQNASSRVSLEPGEIYAPRSLRHELEYQAYLYLLKEDPQFIESGHFSPALNTPGNVLYPATSTEVPSLPAQDAEEQLERGHSTEGLPPADIQVPDIPVNTFPVSETEQPQPAQTSDIPVDTLPEIERPEPAQVPEQIPDEELGGISNGNRAEEQLCGGIFTQDYVEPEQQAPEDAQKVLLERAKPFASQTIRSGPFNIQLAYMEQSREVPVSKPSVSISDTNGTVEIMMPVPKGMGAFDLKIGESLISLNMDQGAKETNGHLHVPILEAGTAFRVRSSPNTPPSHVIAVKISSCHKS